ncbi:MAG: bifunctional folylpolyglutamate synthase/dihydrofolate synthase [Cryomorphaceae bacterium]|nr:MAG: bifunctional folylpolyglutamate synthase/dihydrofolate synthase [Cryomorphaceae bacterium]
MTYAETLNYLFSQLPMYQRIGAAAYKADLSTTIHLLHALGNPEKSSVRYIHIAGTNGKGSVSHMIASVLQEAGYKTGLFTSPHLRDFRERIRINGAPISEETVVNFVTENSAHFEAIQPSFFEMTAALAFQVFKDESVDFAVLETGMGGRLDSTNVITPLVSVITNIGMDHSQFLGNTIQSIAAEKAGIIKPEVPIVAGNMRPVALEVIRSKSKEQNSPLTLAPMFLPENIQTDLKGGWQQENLRTAFAALTLLSETFTNITQDALIKGLGHVVTNTGIRGRWEWLSRTPRVVCDVAHNEDGLGLVTAEISKEKYRKLLIVLGVVNDKDLAKSLPLFPKEATYFFCAAQIPRAKKAEELALEAAVFGLHGEVYPSVQSALQAAKALAHPTEDLIFVGGSFFTVAEVIPASQS